MNKSDLVMRILPTEKFDAKKMGLLPPDCKGEILATVGDTFGHRVQIVKVSTGSSEHIQLFGKQLHGIYEKISYIDPVVLEALKKIELNQP